jgi:FkbM family methyltransferase
MSLRRSVEAMRRRPVGSAARWYEFPPVTALKLGAAALLSRLLGPHARITYACVGEDRVIDGLLRLPAGHRGFYVDVGANDPVDKSNTFALYRRGWRGVTVEANSELVERHRKVRPGDRAVCAVVSDETHDLTFTEFQNAGLSTVEETHPSEWARKEAVRRHRRVRPRTLTDILESEAAPERFELLSVDVEGHDLHVLRSLDLSRYRPQLVVAEIHGLRIANDPGLDPVVALLAGHGYELVAYAVLDGYFLDREAGGG